MRALALALVLASAPARADDCDLLDPAPGTWTLHPPSHDAPEPSSPADTGDGSVETGQATLGTLDQAQTDGETLMAGEVSASGRAGWLLGPQACGSADVIAGTQSRADTTAHVVFPYGPEVFMLGFEQQWRLRPRLDSSRIWLPRLYSSTLLQFNLAPIAWADQDGRAALFPIRLSSMRRDQDTARGTLQTVHFSIYESNRPDGRTELLPMTWTAMYPHGVERIGADVSSELTRVDAMALTQRWGALTIDAAGGAEIASRSIEVPLAGSLGLTWGPWSARVERGAYLAMDDSITIENRVTAGFRDGIWRAGGFAALTHTSSDPEPQATGGGSAGVDVDLPEELKLAVDVEVARSYYARLDGDPSPTPQLAAIGTLRLTRHFGENPTTH